MKKRFAALSLAALSFALLEAMGWGVSKILDWAWTRIPTVHMNSQDVWGAISLLGMAASVALFFWPQTKKPSKPLVLAEKAREAAILLEQELKSSYLVDRYRLQQALTVAYSTRITFHKSGFATPVFPDDAPMEEIAGIMLRYFVAMMTLLEQGHEGEARQTAKQFAESQGRMLAG